MQRGQVRALAVTGAKRSPLFPEVPTVAEAGLPGLRAPNCIMASSRPAGTPPEIVAKLNAALNARSPTAASADRLAVDGAETLPGTPQAYADDIAGEEAKWSAVIKKTGVKAE